MNQTATQIDYQPELLALWERLGPLRTLRRRSGLREVA